MSEALRQPPIARWREVMAELGVPATGTMSWQGPVNGLTLRASTARSPVDGSFHVELSEN